MIVLVEEVEKHFGPGRTFRYASVFAKTTGRRDLDRMIAAITAANAKMAAIGGKWVLVIQDYPQLPLPGRAQFQLALDELEQLLLSGAAQARAAAQEVGPLPAEQFDTIAAFAAELLLLAEKTYQAAGELLRHDIIEEAEEI